MTVKSTLAYNMRAIRHARNLSIDNFAKVLDISKNTLQNIELGHYYTSLATLEQIANSLDLPAYMLLKPASAGENDPISKFFDSFGWFYMLPHEEQCAFADMIHAQMELLMQHAAKHPSPMVG